MNDFTYIYPSYFSLTLNQKTGTKLREAGIPLINGHIHTPFSFSAFTSMEQPFQMAQEEGISVLGINDFYTTDGYQEFAELAVKFSIFPLFNIEFMALQKEEQAAGIRINDPVNPGRTYLSGKGLRYPVGMSSESLQILTKLQKESNLQTYQMVEKLNGFLAHTSTGLRFDASVLQKKLARNLFRERHIATAIRLALFDTYQNEAAITDALTELFSGKGPKSSVQSAALLENEIRNNLLKSGGPAYVPEDEKAFLSLQEVTGLIRDAGGIPCYPVLLDDARGNFTGFESDWERMAQTLIEKGIYMIELIPGRNDYKILMDFVSFFRKAGFPVTFGTEHNTPQLDPLMVTCRGNYPLGEDLSEINYEGAAIIAAHQYQIAHGKIGFPGDHFPAAEELKELATLGKEVIHSFTKS